MKPFNELSDLYKRNFMTILLLHIKDLEITKGFKVSITLTDINNNSYTISDKDILISDKDIFNE